MYKDTTRSVSSPVKQLGNYTEMTHNRTVKVYVQEQRVVTRGDGNMNITNGVNCLVIQYFLCVNATASPVRRLMVHCLSLYPSASLQQ
jgi:hypothetical protein